MNKPRYDGEFHILGYSLLDGETRMAGIIRRRLILLKNGFLEDFFDEEELFGDEEEAWKKEKPAIHNPEGPEEIPELKTNDEGHALCINSKLYTWPKEARKETIATDDYIHPALGSFLKVIPGPTQYWIPTHYDRTISKKGIDGIITLYFTPAHIRHQILQDIDKLKNFITVKEPQRKVIRREKDT